MGRGSGPATPTGTSRRTTGARKSQKYDPQLAHDSCRVLNSGPLTLSDLPEGLFEDDDVQANLDLRFGKAANLHFRLVEVPLSELTDYKLPDEFDEFFAGLIASDEDWEAEAQAGGVPEFDFEDGADRYEVAKQYLQAFQNEEDVTPIIIDFWGIHNSQPDLLDGHHRLAAAHEAGAKSIVAFEIIAAEPNP